MVRVAGWLVVAVALFAAAPVHAGGHRELDPYQRAYGWYAPGQYVHDEHRYEHGAHGIAWRGTERPAWRWCEEYGEWVPITRDHDVGWRGGIDPAEVHARVPRHLHDPSLREARDGGHAIEEFDAYGHEYAYDEGYDLEAGPSGHRDRVTAGRVRDRARH